MNSNRLGVLGGTFDPVHNGHLAIADGVRRMLDLDEVLFMPAGHSVFKENVGISNAEHRMEMVTLATAGNPFFNVSTIEMERPGPSYSIDTISELKAQSGSNSEIYLIVGYDTLHELPQWKDPQCLLQMCHIAAVKRPGYDKPDIDIIDAAVWRARDRIIFIEAPYINISASDIRQRVIRGLSVTDIVPESVAMYIAANNLYTAGGSGN